MIVPIRELATQSGKSTIKIKVTILLIIRMGSARINNEISLFVVNPEGMKSKRYARLLMLGANSNKKRGMIRYPPREVMDHGITKKINLIRGGKSIIDSSDNFSQTIPIVTSSERRPRETKVNKTNRRNEILEAL